MDEKEYQREYYQKNKERINQAKKERYHKDAEYREKIRIKAKARHVIQRLKNPPVDHTGEPLLRLKDVANMLQMSYPHFTVVAKKYLPPPYKETRGGKYYRLWHYKLLEILYSIPKLPYRVLSKAINKFWDGPYPTKEVLEYARKVRAEWLEGNLQRRSDAKHGKLRKR